MYDGRSKEIAIARATRAGLASSGRSGGGRVRQCGGRGVGSGSRRSCRSGGRCLSGISLSFADSLGDGVGSWAGVVATIFRICCTVF